MLSPLSKNEIEILDRQVATLNYQLGEIARLLESRLGETAELAISARTVCDEFSRLAQRIHRQNVAGSAEEDCASRSQTA